MKMQRLTWALVLGLVVVLSAGCAVGTPVAAPAPTHTPTPPYSPTPCPEPVEGPTSFPPTTASPLGAWQPLPTDGLPGPHVTDIAFATPDVAFLAADGDVFRSGDGGTTWGESLSIYRAIQSVAVSPGFAADRTVFAVDGGSRLLRSTDGGGTWEPVTRIADDVGGASDEVVWLSISPAYPADPTLWATAVGAAYRSTDGGLTWEPFDPGVELTREARLVPNPNYPADPALKVVDYLAVEWSPLPQGLLHRPTFLAASGATLLLGTSRGLYRSPDGGATWSEADAGLPRASMGGALAVAPDGTLYAPGTGDPRLFRLGVGGARWEPLGVLPGPVQAIGAVGGAGAPPVLLVTTTEGWFVSRDGGVTWDSLAGAGLPAVDLAVPLPALSPNFVLAGDGVAHVLVEGIVYRSDGGDDWAALEGVSGVMALVETPDRRLIGLAPGAVYEWDPAMGMGRGWTRHPADFDEGPVTVRFVTERLAVAAVGGDVYLSEDGGRAWTAIGRATLGRFPVLISPRFDVDGAIYAQDDSGVYVSTDAGRTWVEAGVGLPDCAYDSPECGLELLRAERSADGYRVYALVRHDFHSHVWVARAEGN